MNIKRWRTAYPVAVTVFLLAVSVISTTCAYGQYDLNISIGWNQGLHNNLESRESVVDSRAGLVYSLEIFNGDFRDESRISRFGFSITTQNVKTIPEQGENYATNFRASFLQAEFERVVLRGSFATVFMGLGFGFGWRTDRNENSAWNYCDTAFCDMPAIDLVFSPDIKAIVPVAGKWSLTAGVRGNIYSEGETTTYPYKAGAMFLFGISYFGDPQPRRPSPPLS